MAAWRGRTPQYTWAQLFALTGMAAGDEAIVTDVPTGGRSRWYYDATQGRWRVYAPTLIAENTSVIDGAQQTAAQYLGGLTVPAGILKLATFEHRIGFGKSGTTDAAGTATYRLGTGVIGDAAIGTFNMATQLGAANRSVGTNNWFRMTTATNLQKLGGGSNVHSWNAAGNTAAPNADVTVHDVTTTETVIGASVTMGGAVADVPQLTYQALILQP
jgi:hypothetical protein